MTAPRISEKKRPGEPGQEVGVVPGIEGRNEPRIESSKRYADLDAAPVACTCDECMRWRIASSMVREVADPMAHVCDGIPDAMVDVALFRVGVLIGLVLGSGAGAVAGFWFHVFGGANVG